jgi:hypothetical protein
MHMNQSDAHCMLDDVLCVRQPQSFVLAAGETEAPRLLLQFLPH